MSLPASAPDSLYEQLVDLPERLVGQFKDQNEVIVEPFSALALALADLWIETEA
jgi:hypothetical protein